MDCGISNSDQLLTNKSPVKENNRYNNTTFRILLYQQTLHIHEAQKTSSSGNKQLIKEQTKSFPKEQFWLFSTPRTICLLRFLAEGIFYTYPHSIVPTGLGIRLNGQLFMYATIGT